jgi:outer membrane immunogenic protein
MKRVLSMFAVAAISAAGMGLASAADLPVKAPVRSVAAPVSTWTGCYVGVNGGYGWAHKNWHDFNPYADQGSSTSTGGAFGGQLGCDYQTGAFVFGVQGMWDWASLDGSHPYASDPFYTDHSKVTSFATLTGRLGYAVQPASLLYVKGGAAWVRDKFTETCSDASYCPGTAKATRTGWTVGGGLEYRFAPSWSAFVEYNYMDFGRKTSRLIYVDGSPYDYDIKQNVQTLLVGINYRFGGLTGPGY